MDAYFTAIGIPSFAISFVKRMSEVRTIEPPAEPGGEWRVVVETGTMIVMNMMLIKLDKNMWSLKGLLTLFHPLCYIEFLLSHKYMSLIFKDQGLSNGRLLYRRTQHTKCPIWGPMWSTGSQKITQ